MATSASAWCPGTSSQHRIGEDLRCRTCHPVTQVQCCHVPPELAANLASLNEIITEMVQALAGLGVSDQPFADTTCGVLRSHSHALGFVFQGEHPSGLDAAGEGS